MRIHAAALTALLIFGSDATASAQQESVDVSRLPIDLSRIERQLKQASVRDESKGLDIRYVVDVYGRAPRIDILTKDDNLVTGPVPYGAPTHREMVNAITPQAFRAPVMNLGALVGWLRDKGKQDK